MANILVTKEKKYVPTTDTVGYWKLNNNGLDSGPNNLVSAVCGITYYDAGISKQCGLFSGTTTYLQVAHSATLNGDPSGITVMGWFYMSSTGPRSVTVLDKGRDAYGAWSLRATTVARFTINTGGKNGVVAAGTTLQDRWYHTSATYDGESIKLYLNGNLVATSGQTGGIGTNTIDLRIGKMNDNAIPTYGYIDEVIYEKRAWSADEIKWYYNKFKLSYM